MNHQQGTATIFLVGTSACVAQELESPTVPPRRCRMEIRAISSEPPALSLLSIQVARGHGATGSIPLMSAAHCFAQHSILHIIDAP